MSQHEKINLSIHPRNWPAKVFPWPQRRKLNTSLQPNPSTKEKVIEGIREHVSRHPNDVVSKSRLKTLMVS